MSKFFIQRPIFSAVLAIAISLVGFFALTKMPLEQYPNIAPPSVSIRTSLPGASAEVLENSVTQVIEQALVGIDNMRYFSSQTDSDGNASIVITFESGTNPDIAQVQVQNKLQNAMPLLPQTVQQQGVFVTKSNSNFLMTISLYSTNKNVKSSQISDILLTNIQDQIARVNGVGMVRAFGSQSAMRIWLNPLKLYRYGLTTNNVLTAIRSQNVDVSSGQIGGLPSLSNQGINVTILARGRMSTVKEFENIVLKTGSIGSVIKLKDVARVEIGSRSYSEQVRYNSYNASGMAVILASGANALKTSELVKNKMEELRPTLPEGIEFDYPYDSMPFVKKSIKNVVKTLIEAILLVFIVILLFLQNFRATLVPIVAVPIVLFGTCIALYTMGFSLNTFTMFAMVITIGLLVDDAIVVVENVERIMKTQKLSVRQATIKSMEQITGALVGIAVVLSAVFIPMAFFGGVAGAIYKQFAITIVVAMVLSVFVAIVVSPSVCIFLLGGDGHDDNNKHGFFAAFAKFFNFMVSKLMNFYVKLSVLAIRKIIMFVVIYFGIIAGALFLFVKLPKSFLPTDDQGFMYFMITAPTGSTLQRTDQSVKQVEKYLLETEKDVVDRVFALTGYSSSGSAQNVGFGFIGLKDWSERTNYGQSVMELSQRTSKNLSKLKDAVIFTYFPPPIRELGNASGFDMQLLDTSGLGHKKMMEIRKKFLEIASADPKLQSVRAIGLDDVAQLKIDIKDDRATSMGIDVAEINNTLQTAIGSSYVNDFIDKGRVKRVFMQGDAKFRMMQKDVLNWYVKNNKGKMTPIKNVANYRWIYGPSKLERFNGVKSFNFQGAPAVGVSTGDAMKRVEQIIKDNFQNSVGIAWTGVSYEEKTSQSKTGLLYAISMLFVFLCLAALYESWAVPLAVMLTVPFGIMGAALFCHFFKMANDIYFQVAILTTIGLCAKNAILIVEFAKQSFDDGTNVIMAAIKAVKLRFRPILMTSLAFVLGILPLVFASGAGSASQKAIGVALVGGTLSSTFVAIIFTPLFFVLVISIFKIKQSEKNS